MTEDVRQRARQDYESMLGKRLLVRTIDACIGDDIGPVDCDPPVLVEVITTEGDQVERTVDDWLDPIWRVKLLQDRPALEGAHSLTVYGFSYNLDTGERTEPHDWEPTDSDRKAAE